MIPYRRRTETTRIILHASHTVPGAKPTAIEWYLEAQGRRMGLLDIGYHYVIRADGTLFEARPNDTIGSHCPGFNKDSIGVCLEGGLHEEREWDAETNRVEHLIYPGDTFSDTQKQTLKLLVGYLQGFYPDARLQAHSELGRYKYRLTQCPPLDMAGLRKELAA